jgi:spore coat protein CotH
MRTPPGHGLALVLLLAGGLLACDEAPAQPPVTGAGTQAPFVAVFDSEDLPVFEIELPDSSYRGLAADPFVYQPGRLRYRSAKNPRLDVALAAVGVRLKGHASFAPIDRKPSLKIRFDTYVRRQHFLGLRRLTLDNMSQDPSMVRERLAYHVFSKEGLIAPLCNHARVFLNGQYYGLYTNVQTIDRIFVEAHYRPAPGNLYAISNDALSLELPPVSKRFLELRTNRKPNDTSDLDEMLRAINGPSDRFLEEVESKVDLDEWLKVGAVQAMIADWDGYFGNQNNYLLYHDLGRGRFVLFPWGCDQTFGIADGRFTHLAYRIDGSSSGGPNGRLFQRCKESPECYRRYLAHVRRLAEAWEGLDLPRELDRILTQIRPSVLEDRRRGYPLREFERSVQDVREFLLRRGRLVRRQLGM